MNTYERYTKEKKVKNIHNKVKIKKIESSSNNDIEPDQLCFFASEMLLKFLTNSLF